MPLVITKCCAVWHQALLAACWPHCFCEANENPGKKKLIAVRVFWRGKWTRHGVPRTKTVDNSPVYR